MDDNMTGQSAEIKDNISLDAGVITTPQRRLSRNSSLRLSSHRNSEVYKSPSMVSNTPKGFDVHSSVMEGEASMSMDLGDIQMNEIVAQETLTEQDSLGFSVSEHVPPMISKQNDTEGWTATPLKHQSLGEVTNNFGFKYPLQESTLEDPITSNLSPVQATITKSPLEPVKERTLASIRRASTIESIAKSPLVLHEPLHVKELFEEDTLAPNIETEISEAVNTNVEKDTKLSPNTHKIDALSEALDRLCRPLAKTAQ